MDVLIPTCRPAEEVSEMVREIEATMTIADRVIASCQPGSASFNRNWCLDRCESHRAIMLDDDIRGFYPGWDADLVKSLAGASVAAVSARLMRPNGKIAQTCSRSYELTPDEIEVEPYDCCVMPTAAIAFRNVGIRFDEGFRGSGFEDGDWFFSYRKQFPDCRFIQSNRCRLIHLNEMKCQREHWRHNKAHFEAKWKIK
jgi:glycosyltransferase involved in cell wall biosynthesis